MYNYQLMTRFGVDPDHDADTGFFLNLTNVLPLRGKEKL